MSLPEITDSHFRDIEEELSEACQKHLEGLPVNSDEEDYTVELIESDLEDQAGLYRIALSYSDEDLEFWGCIGENHLEKRKGGTYARTLSFTRKKGGSHVQYLNLLDKFAETAGQDARAGEHGEFFIFHD